VVKTDIYRLLAAFPDSEHREFLMEMLEPEMYEGRQTLLIHQEEELETVDDIEAFMNNMGRQKRRMVFLEGLYKLLEGSLDD
jgi:hypothetical protein